MAGAVTSVATSIDEDGSRKKRRKTDSPKNEPRALQGRIPSSQYNRFGEAAVSAGRSISQPGFAIDAASNSKPEGVACTVGARFPSKDTRNQHEEPSNPTVTAVAVLKDTPPRHGKATTEPKTQKSKGTSRRVGSGGATKALSRACDAPIDSAAAPEDLAGLQKPARRRNLPSSKRIKGRPDGDSSAPTAFNRSSRSPQDKAQRHQGGASTQEGLRKMIKVRADGKLVSPKFPKPEAKPLVEEPRDSVPSQEPASPTVYASEGQKTPKKLMKVRSDGRLASPKIQANADGVQKKRRGRPKKLVEAVKTGLVIIKYGITEESRISVGQRIQELLSSSQSHPRSNDILMPVAKPPEPPRDTHPFFLGKNLQKPQPNIQGHKSRGNNDSQATGSESEYSTSPAQRKSPRKAPACVDGGSWVGTEAPGQNRTLFCRLGPPKFTGAHDPIWPPLSMVHIRPQLDVLGEMPSTQQLQIKSTFEPAAGLKLKQVKTMITESEEVLSGCRSTVKICEANDSTMEDNKRQPKPLRIPQRRIMSSHDLQQLYRQSNIFNPFTPTRPRSDHLGELSGQTSQSGHSHPALSRLLSRIATSQTAFDRFECETQDWNQKYAPTRVEEVLQPGNETSIFRDWLRSLAVNSVGRGEGKAEGALKMLNKLDAGVKKKKRKRAQELDGFVVSSDEEANELDELDDDSLLNLSQPQNPRDSKTVINRREATKLAQKSEKSANAIILSGAGGCGKTAAVYAIAQELGFEVFEINAGNRRSGKDILDKVGDMSRNHLVNQRRASETGQPNPLEDDLSRIDDALQQDIGSGKQGTMNAFLQPKKKKNKPFAQAKRLEKDHVAETKSKPRAQKQSVILLEEVDVLFEDDKQFWATIMELVVLSRRPIVMTCTDESLLPLDGLPLFGILRFRPPPVQLATEYLSLLAANEGHLLPREAVSALFTVKGNDLRASITELQFFCQMAIGDTKGGLEWMLDQPATKDKQSITSKRVISDGTYLKGMGWIGQQDGSAQEQQQVNSEIGVVSAVCSDWDIDLAETDDFLPQDIIRSLPSDGHVDSLKHLGILDLVYDALSAADTLQCPSFQEKLTLPLDVSAPMMSEKDRVNFTENPVLLQADLLVDQTGVSDLIAAALRVFSRRSLVDAVPSQQITPLNQQYITNTLPLMVQAQRRPKPVTTQTLSTAFSPLSKPSRGSLAGKGPLLSTFEQPISIVVSDVAPYVRSIVSYDLRLEEQRRQLDLASQSGRDGKRARTTRASRAALEGGSKANTRRERWFPGIADLGAVLRTGGTGWQEEVLRTVGETVDVGGYGQVERREQGEN
ncbi:MAG: hypothetical protein LQ338_004786 [Usnochroma carphineum]|nr:MAG: hypothetical protein LQ338_004786 [Usnochroma carphineum]